ncbi:MAG: hypothetical protein ABI435_00330 [Pseudolysinimonas sp.]
MEEEDLAGVASRFGGDLVTRPREFRDAIPDLALLATVTRPVVAQPETVAVATPETLEANPSKPARSAKTAKPGPEAPAGPRPAGDLATRTAPGDIAEQAGVLAALSRRRWPAILGAAVAVLAAVAGTVVLPPLLDSVEPRGPVAVNEPAPATVADGDVANLVLLPGDLEKLVGTPTTSWGPATVTDEWLAGTASWLTADPPGCGSVLNLTGASAADSGAAYGLFSADAATTLYSFGRVYVTAAEAATAFANLHPTDCETFAAAVPGGSVVVTSEVANKQTGTTGQGLVWSANRVTTTLAGTPAVTVDRWCGVLDRIVVCTTAWGESAKLDNVTVAAAEARFNGLEAVK